MYPLKKSTESTETADIGKPEECFGAQVKYWFWIMFVMVVGTIIFAILNLRSPGAPYSSVAVSAPQGGQLQPIAWTRCPSCPQGQLDAQGRCNVSNCPQYRPGWRGQVPVGQNVAWAPCRRCVGGQLNAQGRCNQRGCVLYGGTGLRGGQPQAGGWARQCPNCVQGALDPQGRCNVSGCLLYRPGRSRQVPTGQAIAFTPCPRCTGGQLDVNGRCNQKGCVLYGVGKMIPVKVQLVKELALTIGASQGKNTVIIQAVYGSGNADKAGLKVGDRITRFNGRKITSVKQFQATVARAAPEAMVKIEVFRLEKKQTFKVMVGEGEMEGAVIPPAK